MVVAVDSVSTTISTTQVVPISVSYPATVPSGALVIVGVGRARAQAFTARAGWTELHSVNEGTNIGVTFFRRDTLTDGTEGGTTATVADFNYQRAYGAVMWVLTGTDLTATFNAATGTSYWNTNSPAVPSLSVLAGSITLAVACVKNPTTDKTADPAGYTADADLAVDGPSTSDAATLAAHKVHTADETTGGNWTAVQDTWASAGLNITATAGSTGTLVKYYDGSAWQTKTMKHYDGTGWNIV